MNNKIYTIKKLLSEQPKGEILLKDKENESLLKDVPKKSIVWESHNDEVKHPLPEGFIALAHSDNCQIQAVKYQKKLFYGVQFHPEVEHTEYGYDIFKNFLKLCEPE